MLQRRGDRGSSSSTAWLSSPTQGCSLSCLSFTACLALLLLILVFIGPTNERFVAACVGSEDSMSNGRTTDRIPCEGKAAQGNEERWTPQGSTTTPPPSVSMYKEGFTTTPRPRIVHSRFYPHSRIDSREPYSEETSTIEPRNYTMEPANPHLVVCPPQDPAKNELRYAPLSVETTSVAPTEEVQVEDLSNDFPSSREKGPDGKYCGSFSLGVIKGELLAKQTQSRFDFHMEGLNHNITCENEAYAYDPLTHHADVPGSRDPEDCLGSLLTGANLTLDVLYYPKSDQVKLDFGFTYVKCKKCE